MKGSSVFACGPCDSPCSPRYSGGGAIGLAARPEVRRSRIFTGLTDGVSEELEYARSNGEGRFFVRVFPTDLAVAAIYRQRVRFGGTRS